MGLKGIFGVLWGFLRWDVNGLGLGIWFLLLEGVCSDQILFYFQEFVLEVFKVIDHLFYGRQNLRLNCVLNLLLPSLKSLQLNRLLDNNLPLFINNTALANSINLRLFLAP